MSKSITIGFIGLGAMGWPMAANLVEKGPKNATFYIFDVIGSTMQKLHALDKETVMPCQSAKEVASHSDIIFTIVPEGSHARSVYLDPSSGIVSGSLGSKLFVDCSTIDVETSLHIAHELRKIHPAISFYDAPVSGGVLGAESGFLTFMLGCAPDDHNFAYLRKLLSIMGTTIIPCGQPSFGLVAKLCNNYCSGLIAIATAEAMDIAMRSGVDPRIIAQIFSTSTAQSTQLDKFCPVPGVVPTAPSSNGYRGGFKVELMRKDFDLACKAAEKVGARPMLAKVGLETYTAAAEDPKCKNLDSRVIFRYLGGDEGWKSRFPD